jgi:hypothetical protein
MRAYVDKVEGGKAELRLGEAEGAVVVVPLKELPKGVGEGDVLKVSFAIDAAGQKADAAALEEQRRRLLERSKDQPL